MFLPTSNYTDFSPNEKTPILKTSENGSKEKRWNLKRVLKRSCEIRNKLGWRSTKNVLPNAFLEKNKKIQNEVFVADTHLVRVFVQTENYLNRDSDMWLSESDMRLRESQGVILAIFVL